VKGRTTRSLDLSRSRSNFGIPILVVLLLVHTFLIGTYPDFEGRGEKALVDGDPTPHADAGIVVDPGIQHQTIAGWSATAWAAQDGNPAFANYSDDLFDQAVLDLGLNRLRVEIRAGVENPEDYWSQYMSGQVNYTFWRQHRYSTINDNNDPNVINWSGYHFSELDNTIEKVVLPFKQRVESNGERLYINVNYVAFTGQIGPGLQYIHDDPDEYAELVLATLLHLESNYSIVPDSWEILLEPDNVAQWNGNLIGRAMVAVAARLDAHGLKPNFIAPSNTNMGNAINYFDAMVQVPGAVQNLSEFSYHRYGGVSDANLRAIAARGEQYGVDTSMLEHIGSGYQDLYKDLTIANNSAWQQFTLGGPGGGDSGGKYYLIDDTDPANPTVTIASRTKYLRQYFKFIREGAVRIEAISNNSNFEPAAFINVDGSNVVVVMATSGGSMAIHGLPDGTYHIKYTTGSQYDVDLPNVTITAGQSVDTSIPGAGVITVYGIGIPRPPAFIDATLNGPRLENVTLSWDISPDDGAGFASVAGYNIYRGTAHNPYGAGYGLVASLTNGTDTFTDVFAGEGDPNGHFYQVCALSFDGNVSCGGNQAAKFTRPVPVGGNLVSIPLIQSDGSIHVILRTVNFDRAWSFDSLGQRWKSYSASKPYTGTLTTFDHTEAVWLNVTEDSNLTVAGLVPVTTSIDLVEGWNLVGYPSFNSTMDAGDLRAYIPVTNLEGYEPTTPPYFLRELADIDPLQAGFGIWAHMSSSAIWVVNNF
jgi:hypothetical protein